MWQGLVGLTRGSHDESLDDENLKFSEYCTLYERVKC